MVIRIFIYFLILFLGFILGNKNKISNKLYEKVNIIQNVCLFFLLFIMGTRIGLDNSVIVSFFSIGYKAIIISVTTIFVTIVIVKFISKFIINRKGEKKIES